MMMILVFILGASASTKPKMGPLGHFGCLGVDILILQNQKNLHKNCLAWGSNPGPVGSNHAFNTNGIVLVILFE